MSRKNRQQSHIEIRTRWYEVCASIWESRGARSSLREEHPFHLRSLHQPSPRTESSSLRRLRSDPDLSMVSPLIFNRWLIFSRFWHERKSSVERDRRSGGKQGYSRPLRREKCCSSLDSVLYLVLRTILGHDGLMLTGYVKRFKTLWASLGTMLVNERCEPFPRIRGNSARTDFIAEYAKNVINSLFARCTCAFCK